MGCWSTLRWHPVRFLRTLRRLAILTLLLSLAPGILNLTLPTRIARADTVTYSGALTTASPSFNSPTAAFGTCNPTSIVVTPPEVFYYHAQSFTVSTAGTYTLTNLANTFDEGDSLFLLYTPSFDPSSPLTNLLAANDDGPTDLKSQISCALNSGTPYILVTTTFTHLDTGTFSNHITGPGTVTLSGPSGQATLNGTVALQGLASGSAAYQVELQVRLFQPGTTTLVGTFTANTDPTGGFSVSGLPPGTYDVEVKEGRRIGRIARNLTLVAGTNTRTFGDLLAGDVNNDDVVGLVDYSRLRASYGRCDGDTGYQPGADFNGDACVGLQDYSRLRANYGVAGPLNAP